MSHLWKFVCLFLLSGSLCLAEEQTECAQNNHQTTQPIPELVDIYYQTASKKHESVARHFIDTTGNTMRSEQLFFLKNVIEDKAD